MIQKAEAVVLKTLNHGDTSKIITLYSREVGRLKLIAKGVRSPTSKAAGLFQPTRHLQVVYYTKTHSELQLFKSGDLVNGFFGLENDFDRLTLALVVVELLDRSVEDEESHPQLFELLTETLSRLSNSQVSAAAAYWYFHLHLLRELGFRPHVGRCSNCHDELVAGGYLGASTSDLECLKCHPATLDSISVSAAVLQATERLLSERWSAFDLSSLSARDRRSFWDFLWRYTFYHIETTRNMRSLKVLKQLYP